MSDLQEYFSDFIKQYQVTDEQNAIMLQPDADNYELKQFNYFSISSKKGLEGINILYPSLEKTQYYFTKSTNKKGISSDSLVAFSRICLMNREPQPDGSIKKYHSPKRPKAYDEVGREIENTENMVFPFWTPSLLEKYQEKEQIKILTMIEGEKKAFKGYQAGFDILGLGSKDGFSIKGEIKKLHPDIVKYINECKVEQLVLLLDADTLAVKPEHLETKKDLFNRAYSFYNTVRNYKRVVNDLMRECKTLKEAYFMHLKPTFREDAKGLDDLLIKYPEQTNAILHDFRQLDRAESYFGGFRIEEAKDVEIRDYFGISSHDLWIKEVDNFYKVYQDSLNKQDFVFKDYHYTFNEDENRYNRQLQWLSNGVVTYDMSEYKITVYMGKNTSVTVAKGFLIFVKYLTVDENEKNTWVLEIKQSDKPEIYMEVSHDDFHDAKKMEKLFSSKRLPLNVTDGSLKEIRNFLISETQFNDAQKILRYGFHPETELFFLGNNVFTKKGEILTPDEFGIISYQNHHLSMPTIGKGKQPLYLHTDNKINFNRWYNLFKEAQREELTFISASWLINSVFRDLAIKYKGFSPILFITGIAGTAKSTIFRHLNYWFAPETKELEMNIKGKNTNAAFTAKVEQRYNGNLFCDEYYPDHPLEDAFQASYDNKAYSKMDMAKNGLETLDLIPKTSIGIASNFKPNLPQSEPLFTRMVLLINNVRTFTEARKKAYAELQVIQEKGLSNILLEIWKNRDLVNNQYLIAYAKILKAIEKLTSSEKDMPSRLIANLAVVLTPSYILHTNRKITICEYAEEKDVLDFFATHAYHSIMNSWRMMRDKSTLREFFEICQDFFDKGQLIADFHYKFDPNDESTIILNIRKLYNKYAEEYRRMTRFEVSPPSKSDIEDNLLTLVGLDSGDEGIRENFFQRIRMKQPDSNETKAEYGCCRIKYSLLVEQFGIDFQYERWKKNNL